MKRCLLIVLFCAVICSVNAASDKPNVIMIYADDLGKGMLSAYGQKHFTTPNIDALINGGVSFSRAYGSSMTPKARAALLTGYHDCNHLKWRISRGGAYSMDDMKLLDVNESFLNDNDIPLEANDPYLPQVFKDAGYLTAQIGMLGWGNTTTRKQMTMHGWSYYYGYLDHFRSQGYYPTFLFENGEMAKIEGNTRSDCGKGRTPENEQTYKERWNMEGKHAYAPDSMLTKTLEFIRYFKDTPFFVLFSTQLPHGPVSIPSVHPEVANNDALTPIEKEYASMVKLLDDQVGVIMAELRALGIEDNTIVIFTSDNGHEISYQQQGRFEPPFSDVSTGERFDDSYFKYYGYKAGDVFNGNANLAGLKQSNLEGGIRVPLTFYRKGHLQKRVCDQIVAAYDFLPTMADMLNIKLKIAKNGVSYLPLLKKDSKLPKSRYIVAGSREGPALLMNDGWKLRYFYKKKKFELYNIRDDEEEKYDVILRYPDKAKELETILLKECDGNLDRGTFL